MVPLNPFMLFDYFLLDSVERDLIREANNSLVLRADELWTFGPISNGVLAEILLAQEADKPIHYFKIIKPHKVIPANRIEMEEEVEQFRHLLAPVEIQN